MDTGQELVLYNPQHGESTELILLISYTYITTTSIALGLCRKMSYMKKCKDGVTCVYQSVHIRMYYYPYTNYSVVFSAAIPTFLCRTYEGMYVCQYYIYTACIAVSIFFATRVYSIISPPTMYTYCMYITYSTSVNYLFHFLFCFFQGRKWAVIRRAKTKGAYI